MAVVIRRKYYCEPKLEHFRANLNLRKLRFECTVVERQERTDIPIPEGPELAHARDKLKNLLEGKRIVDMSTGPSGRYTKKLPEGMEQILSNMRSKRAGPLVRKVDVKGKFMWWELAFDDDLVPWYVHCTYGMSGGWFKAPTKHTAFVVEYSDDASATRERRCVFFNDVRRFGTLKFVQGNAVHIKKLNSLGPCILRNDVTPEIFAESILRKPFRTIAEALMDQRSVAGIGNYLRAEILYDCRISPWTAVSDVSSQKYRELCDASIRIAKASYESQGASIKTYRTVDGLMGIAQFSFKVYGQKNCPLGHDISRRQDSNGRMMHWCNVCQE